MAQQPRQRNAVDLTAEVVREKTGRSWDEWLKALDKAGARMMERLEIIRLLQEQMDLSPWWAKMVASGYASRRGIGKGRSSGLRVIGCEVILTRMIAVARPVVWAAWQDKVALDRWLPGADFTVLKSDPYKAICLDWPDQTRVNARFYDRVGGTRLVVRHGKLGAGDEEKMQAFWNAALDRLKMLISP